MGETSHHGLAIPASIVLAHERPFSLGSLTIDPPTRQIVNSVERLTVEPRVMQLLVVLTKARGNVVSRDELIERCWDGRIVGDDAINHAIGKLRQVALGHGGEFAIETIPRVGYRLVRNGEHSEPAPRSRASRRMVLGSGLAVGAIALGVGAVEFFSGAHEPPPLAKIYYERGVATRGQGYSADAEQSVGYLQQAVDIDPSYSDAWGALAWSYRVLLATEVRSDAPRLATLARSAADRALELDANNADARLALLLLKPHYRRWEEIERGCRRLLALHPQHSATRFHLAYVLGETGRWREAIPHMEQVTRNEPIWPIAKFRLFEELSSAGRFEEADARIDEAMRLTPRHAHFWASKIDYLLLTERPSDAFALAFDESARPIDDDAAVARERMIVDAYVSGSAATRKRALARSLGDARNGEPEVALATTIPCGMFGDLDAAFSLLQGYYFGRGPWRGKWERWPPTHPLFSLPAAPLRTDRRFAELLRDTGLEAFWSETKTQPDFRRFPSG